VSAAAPLPAADEELDVSVVLPCYNERDHVELHHLRVTGSTVLVGLAAFNIIAIALLADLVVRRTATD
jgi:hypothetical protein